MLTLAGQPTEYWEDHTKVNELHPLLHQLLAYHPLAFVAVKAVILLAFISLILLIPRNSAMILSLLLSFAALSGPGTWLLNMPGHPGYRHGSGVFWGLVILTAVGMAAGIRWAWKAKPIGIGLLFGLRYGMIALLFVIWLTVDFLATRQLGLSGLVAISPLLLFVGYCSYELFREKRQQKQELRLSTANNDVAGALGGSRMQNEIRNCTVNFQCPKVWRKLTPTDDPKVRFCEYCFEHVHLVETEAQLVEQSALGRCVAILNLSPEHSAYSPDGLLGELTSDPPK
ncbi:MAG TPA: hypothetical protein VG938_12545 [Verrucomicrobiae bacterium]|nr:hypothetical protein [Verrucomicrobiae bacterium]